MGDPAGRAVLVGLVEHMCGDSVALDAVVRAARDKSPQVAGLPEGEVRRNVAAVLDSVGRAFAAASPPDFAAVDTLASDRAAQGVPLAALLCGFQAGRAHLLLKLTDQARSRLVAPETLIAALIELDSYTTDLQNRIIHTYRTMELDLARTGHSIRVQALRGLLHAEPGASAADAGLEQLKRYHCVIADVTDPREAARLEGAFPAGTSGFVDGYLCCVTQRLPTSCQTLMVASPPRPPAQLAALYDTCRMALTSARSRGMRGLLRVTDLALPLAADTHPEIGALLAAELLCGLDPAKDFHRLLARTALTYLEYDRQATRTADALHVHPNTVKHRVRRFSELTTFSSRSLSDAMRWWFALDAWLRSALAPADRTRCG
jgi:hypothetical protein